MIDQAKIDELKEANPNGVFLLRHGDAEAVFKRPTKELYRRFRASVANEARRLDAAERLVYDCLVHPPAPAFSALVELQPALIDTFAGELLEIAGTTKGGAEVVPL